MESREEAIEEEISRQAYIYDSQSMCKGESWSWGERKNKEQEGGIAKEESSDANDEMMTSPPKVEYR